MTGPGPLTPGHELSAAEGGTRNRERVGSEPHRNSRVTHQTAQHPDYGVTDGFDAEASTVVLIKQLKYIIKEFRFFRRTIKVL